MWKKTKAWMYRQLLAVARFVPPSGESDTRSPSERVAPPEGIVPVGKVKLIGKWILLMDGDGQTSICIDHPTLHESGYFARRTRCARVNFAGGLKYQSLPGARWQRIQGPDHTGQNSPEAKLVRIAHLAYDLFDAFRRHLPFALAVFLVVFHLGAFDQVATLMHSMRQVYTRSEPPVENDHALPAPSTIHRGGTDAATARTH